MANDSKTLLARKATALGALSRFDLPKFPQLPASFLRRFPELQQYEEDKLRWMENFNQALVQVLAAPKP